LENDNDGTFTERANIYTGSAFSESAISFFDFTKDGYLDIVTINPVNNDLTILVNDGDETFTTLISAGAVAGDLFLFTDVNNDTVPDILSLDESTNVTEIFLQTPSVLLYGDAATGRVGIGTMSPETKFHVEQSGTGAIATFTDGNSETSCTVDGASFSCSSDERLKKNFEVVVGALEGILQLNPVKYIWNNEDETALQKIGFKAQEVQPLFPELIGQTSNGMLTMNYAGLTPLLAAAIKDVYSQFNSYQPLGEETADTQITAFLSDMRQKVIHGVTHIYELIVANLVTRNLTVEETLCIGEICITETEFLQLLENADIEPVESYVEDGIVSSKEENLGEVSVENQESHVEEQEDGNPTEVLGDTDTQIFEEEVTHEETESISAEKIQEPEIIEEKTAAGEVDESESI